LVGLVSLACSAPWLGSPTSSYTSAGLIEVWIRAKTDFEGLVREMVATNCAAEEHRRGLAA